MPLALFSTAWFGPILYYALFKRADKRLIEGAENYIKQTYRNRCIIATANGPMTLSLPVKSSSAAKTTIKDVKLSNHGDWQRMHWHSIESAYNSSPFFEYYADDIRPFFEKKERWLFDYNEEIRNKICDLIGIEKDVETTKEYNCVLTSYVSEFLDLRDAIRPKSKRLKDLEKNIIKPYYQVFDLKFGFLPNLSILDLLFNMGPESILFL